MTERKIISYDYDTDETKLSLLFNQIQANLEGLLDGLELKADNALIQKAIDTLDDVFVVKAALFGIVTFDDGTQVSADILTKGELSSLEQFVQSNSEVFE